MEERKGYHFAGWYIDKECTKRINPGGILPHTMSLYDKWIPIWYPVVYQTDGGMNSRKNPKYITIESGVIRLYPAKKQGKIFEGWYLDGKRVEYIPEQQCQPVTLVAKYRDFNTVQFETFGGAIIPNMQTNSDKKLEDIRTPMRLGYTFMGWYWDLDYHWQYTYDQTIEEDCTLYARWEVTHFSIIYDVELGAEKEENDFAVSLYIAKEGETLWEVAKALNTDEITLAEQNADVGLPLKGGEKILLYKYLPE